jgi:Copper type II ascorbate-dependent monooxygenase, C-terminal domain
MRIHMMVVVIAAALPLAAQTPAPTVTFYRDALPILQQRCQECHREGEAAPFAMMTYEQTRPWAQAIREAVKLRQMPPWFAEASADSFSNDHRLSAREIETIVAWVDAGAPKGEAHDAPPPRQFTEGWRIGKPDLVVEMPSEFSVPASGEVAWQYFTAKTNFTEDRWIRAVEARPGDAKVVHHIRVFAREPGSTAMMETTVKDSTARQHPKQSPVDDGSGVLAGVEPGATEITTYVPGGDPIVLGPDQAMLIKAGSEVVFEVHYAPMGKPATDRSRVGLILSSEPPKVRVAEIGIANMKLRIPAGAAHHRIDTHVILPQDMTVLSVWPHMHLRGKALQLRAVYPSGESEMLLDIPKYDFNWQMSYVLAKPRMLPKGTRLETVTYFDNSPNNPNNPNPNVDVYWGGQTWEEMNMAFLRVVLAPGVSPSDLATVKK